MHNFIVDQMSILRYNNEKEPLGGYEVDASKAAPFTGQFEENLKKAFTEMLLLYLLSQREYYIGELTETLKANSAGALSIVFPYSALYRLQQAEYIAESKKRTAPDGRRRQYYAITDTGRVYLRQLLQTYTKFIGGVSAVLAEGGESYESGSQVL